MRWYVIALIAAAVTFDCVAAPFQNGSFENAAVDPGSTFVTLPAGNTQITGWTVVSGDIDYIGGLWVASNGGRSLDLVGDQNVGGIQQTFSTIAGATYLLTFDLAGNPGGPPAIKPLDVTVGSTVQSFTFDTSGTSVSAMGWLPQQVNFTATSSFTTLTFISDTTGQGCCYGAAIDNVAVQLLQVPAKQPVPVAWSGLLAALALLVAAGCVFRRSRVR
jgi:choice-of-anchor C domain-containing protein